MKTRMVIILIAFCVSVNTFGQQTTFQDPLLDRMVGEWT